MITRSGVRAVGRSGGNAGREGRWSWGGLRNADAMPWAPQTGRSVIVAAVRRSKAGKVGDDHRAGGRRSRGPAVVAAMRRLEAGKLGDDHRLGLRTTRPAVLAGAAGEAAAGGSEAGDHLVSARLHGGVAGAGGRGQRRVGQRGGQVD